MMTLREKWIRRKHAVDAWGRAFEIWQQNDGDTANGIGAVFYNVEIAVLLTIFDLLQTT